MKTFRFHFNLKYAQELRDAVNDRHKQSIDKTHSDKSVSNKSCWAWNRICAAMDRLEDSITYFNEMELGKEYKENRTAFDFCAFVNNAAILIDCVKTIGRIFNLDENLIKRIEDSSSVFGKELSEQSKDARYFEYIRSLCVVHPLCTNHQKEFLNGSKFHCCPFVTWNGSRTYFGDGADLVAWIYSSDKEEKIRYLNLYVSQFEEYIKKWIDLIPEIIKAKNNYTDEVYERLRNEPVKSLSDYSNDEVRYLTYLKDEYGKRFDYGDEYLFDYYIRVFTIKLSDKRNTKLLEKYKNAIRYSLSFLKNELQNMSWEGYKNNGIKHPESWLETTLFFELGSNIRIGGAFSKFAYEIGKLYCLDSEYYNYAEKLYIRRLLEKPKEAINRLVHFTNNESDKEIQVIVNLALYLESLERKSLLNKNIPNYKKYRLNKLSPEEYKKLFEEEPSGTKTMTLKELDKILEQIWSEYYV